ncbi:ATP-dependent DNA helicase [Cohnella lubricantis]|uniref:ATP-dependent DNA helicase n=1 Tax=Cohnella lubricantis TaxID=2163172 RepID=A0A841TCB7_9BACL|nr:ATP-dependent DNA helicase [Cohnella lubricantis]MBB6676637.1 ATP-dependent DNA helicase [Cohnella lubricantis]MBP2117352.1 ATP-dependent DNA helicase DinG [Cohnella lubricantis]
MNRYPFEVDHSRPFLAQVGEWVADVFYDILPEAGFEVRDEQIYMAYQLERAFAQKQTIFAEAGVGTGKTLVYLLYAICYARYTRKPAIIACADESLIEQLAKTEGDLAKLAQHLSLSIDARLAKSADRYLCLTKLDQARTGNEHADVFKAVHDELPDFVHQYKAMQSFHAYGDRKQYPQLNDQQWDQISWDSFQDCFSCEQRHRCGQTLSREHYRKSSDLIICSHDFYMEHVWTYEGRKREGQLPLLPDHCAVVFDEGHLLESAAQKALTYRLKHSVFEQIVGRLLQNDIRESLAALIDEAIDRSESLFRMLSGYCEDIPGSDRQRIVLSQQLLGEVRRFREVIDGIEEELVFESELYTLNEYQLRIVEEHLEMIQKALSLFQHSEALISWVTEDEDGLTLVIMPRAVKEVLRERVFALNMPVVFSSATLSVNGSFDYIASSLGIDDYVSFSTQSPYDYESQMEVLAPKWPRGASSEERMKAAVSLLNRTGGRALVLFNSKEDLLKFKELLPSYPACKDMRFWFEGDAEISHLISAFQRDETSVLCALTLWEGLDIPGPSLSNVIIWSLPYPPQDPVFMAKREAAASPYEEVDLPYMLLRLQQGMGRLIRSRDDRGIIAILSEEIHFDPILRQAIEDILPQGVALQRECLDLG